MLPSIHRARPVFFLAAALLLAGLPLGCGRAPAPEETPPPAPVKWEEAHQFFLKEWTETLGTTQPLPARAARITAPVEGQVLSVLQGKNGAVVEGQRVRKGDVIVRLDASLAQANRGKIAAAHQELEQLTKQAGLAVQLAEVTVKSLEELNQKLAPGEKVPLVSRIELDKARIALKDAESKFEAAKLRQLAGHKELEALDEQVKLYTLTAPIDGRLGRLLVVPGQTLAPGTLVADVADVDEQIDVLCFVPPSVAKRLKEAQAKRLEEARDKPLEEGQKRGLPARIGAVDDKELDAASPEGEVVFIADQAEVDTGNFAVKVRFPNNNKLGLGVNTTLRIRILTTPGKACLYTLPESALFEDQDPPEVIVVEDYKQETPFFEFLSKGSQTGKARKLQVTLGIRDRVKHAVEVLKLQDKEKKKDVPLDETVKFVVEKGQGLRTGDAIKLEVEEEEAP
jgi:RND family efflux transporter MFP subunit